MLLFSVNIRDFNHKHLIVLKYKLVKVEEKNTTRIITDFILIGSRYCCIHASIVTLLFYANTSEQKYKLSTDWSHVFIN